VPALLLLLLAVALAGCGGGDDPADSRDGGGREARATVVRETRAGPRQVDLEVRSPALGRTAMVRLLTPDGWSEGAARRWPVLYLLHGCCDTYVSWTRSTAIERIAALRRVLVVMPEAGDVGFYSDWLRGPAWERFHLRELRGLLERDYGAGPRRAIAGLSMGGLGALGYAARNPGLFLAAASFSGTLHPLRSPTSYLALFAAFADDAADVWGDPKGDRAVWARHDPTELAGRLRGMPVFVSAGDGRTGPLDEPGAGDGRIEPGVLRESRAFAARARRLGVRVRTDFYGPGTHSWPYWERELRRALPLLLRPLRDAG
jgi:S-formylglutathione hydrolase FrmB